MFYARSRRRVIKREARSRLRARDSPRTLGVPERRDRNLFRIGVGWCFRNNLHVRRDHARTQRAAIAKEPPDNVESLTRKEGERYHSRPVKRERDWYNPRVIIPLPPRYRSSPSKKKERERECAGVQLILKRLGARDGAKGVDLQLTTTRGSRNLPRRSAGGTRRARAGTGKN